MAGRNGSNKASGKRNGSNGPYDLKRKRLAMAFARGMCPADAARAAGYSRSHASTLIHHDEAFKREVEELRLVTSELTKPMQEVVTAPLSREDRVAVGEQIARDLAKGLVTSVAYLVTVVENEGEETKHRIRAAAAILSTRPKVAIQVNTVSEERARVEALPLADLAQETLRTLRGQFGELPLK